MRDESLASFVRRRLGREALERLAEPMAAGIYAADPRRLGLQATFPQFLEMEREHGSVIRALSKRGANRSGPGAAGEQQVSGARYGMFVSFRDGMQTLTDALATRLTGCVQTGVTIRRVARETEVLQFIADGKSSKEIASDMFLSVKTIEIYHKQIMDKLNIDTVAELTKYAISEGLTSL